MTTKKRLQIIAASVERNRRRDAEFAQKQKETAKKKGEKKCKAKRVAARKAKQEAAEQAAST